MTSNFEHAVRVIMTYSQTQRDKLLAPEIVARALQREGLLVPDQCREYAVQPHCPPPRRQRGGRHKDRIKYVNDELDEIVLHHARMVQLIDHGRETWSLNLTDRSGQLLNLKINGKVHVTYNEEED